MVASKLAVLFFTVAFAPCSVFASVDTIIEDGQELYRLAPGELVPENATFSSADLFPEFALKSAIAQAKINSNPLAFENLFKRADCAFTRSDGTYTCVDAGNQCCTYSDNPQDGWCCDTTDACGPGTSRSDCTYRV
jgi:hypothetical protein